MKIGILTITNGENYGNRLQNYASQTVLESLGFEAETIRNKTGTKIDSNAKKSIKKIISSNYRKVRFLNVHKLDNWYRQAKFNEFNNKYIKFSSDIIEKGNVPEHLSNKYNYFISGSDQVWNPEFYFNSEIDFLTFAPREKRIAYSPSFGVSELNDKYKEQYKIWINGMKYLSVREEAGANIIKDLTGREATVLVDPTLMLSKDEWLKIAKIPSWIQNKKYILTYFLGDTPNEIRNEINEIACKRNLKVINLLDKEDKEAYVCDPSEFLALINNCDVFYTDSFHGAVFSIIMQVPFVVVDRRDNNKPMNSRIDTLLKLFDMEERYHRNIDSEQRIFSVNYEKTENIRLREREKSLKYLRQSLKRG